MGKKRSLDPATSFFFINICLESSQPGQTTQDLLLLQGADEECVWISLEETVMAGVVEDLAPWEKQLYLTFAADLLQFMANGIGLKITVTRRNILEPLVVPPVNIVSDPGDVALPMIIWFRNRVLTTDSDEPGAERKHFLNCSQNSPGAHLPRDHVY